MTHSEYIIGLDLISLGIIDFGVFLYDYFDGYVVD